MATYEIEQDGKTFEIDVPEGMDASAAIAQATGQGGAPSSLAAEDAIAALGGGGVDSSEGRGVGLAARALTTAPAKTVTGLADLAGTIGNAGIKGLSSAGEYLFDDQPIDYRFPTNNTQYIDEQFDEIFPAPESFGERALMTGGEMALTGGVASASLAPRLAAKAAPGLQNASRVTANPANQGVVRNLADDIGEFHAKSPVKSTVMEGGGGVGSAVGQQASQELEMGPTGQLLSTVAGGVAGGLAPQSIVNTTRRAATAIQNVGDAALSGEIRAAKTLQGASADAEVSAAKAADAPEGVSPAHATEERGVRALERRVLDDNPAASTKAADDLDVAETKSIKDLSEQFGDTTDPKAWQQEVIVRGAPDGTEIRVGHPDEMLDDAYRGFDGAYEVSKGFPMRTETAGIGKNQTMRESFGEAVNDKGIIASDKWRKGVADFLDGLLDDVSRGVKPERSADSGVVLVDSSVLIEMRSAIREQVRARAKSGAGNNPRAAAEAKMLQKANEIVTTALESQLPEAAAASLRATDLRYKDFLVIEDAVLRSGEKGLTAQALRTAVKASQPRGAVARGQTGEVGRLAATGRSAKDTLGDPDQAARLVRDMTEKQLKSVRADYNKALVDKATPGDGTLRGKKYLEQIDAQEPTLRAAGFDDAAINQMRKVGKELEMIQSRSPSAVIKLLEDDVGRIMRLLGAVAGSKSGSRLLKMLGGAGGAGPSLIVSQWGSKMMQTTLSKLSVDKADALIRAAMTDKELFNHLMTMNTAPLKRQADAARAINAWITRVEGDEKTDE